MRCLFIFLTLPFLLLADQQEIRPCIYVPTQDQDRSFETSWDHSDYCHCKSDFIDPNFYKNRVHITIDMDGHLWTPTMYYHSDYCPCKFKN